MFQQLTALNVSADNSTQLIEGIANPDILIAISNSETSQGGFLFQRSFNSGKVFRVRWVQNGVKGNLISLDFGEHEILLDIPSPLELFDLEILPGRFQFKYSIEISIRVFNPTFNGLVERLGIPLELLNRIPQQTLQILNGIDLDMSTDIRAIKQTAAQLLAATQAAQQTADNAVLAANTADSKAVTAQSVADTNAQEIQAAMTAIADNAANSVQKAGPIAIEADEFTLNSFSGFYEYYLSHGLNDEAPDVEVIDAAKEKQLIQSSGVDANSVKLELTADDIAGNQWPLYAIVIGKPGSVLPIAGNGAPWVAIANNVRYFQRSGDRIDSSIDGVTVETPMVLLNVVSAYLTTISGRLYAAFNDGTYGYLEGTDLNAPLVEISALMYSGRESFPDYVAL